VRFRTSLGLTLVLLALAAAFTRLGYWQLQRMDEKTQLFETFEQAPALALDEAARRGERFARVSARGTFDTRRHFLLDNRLYRGRAGVHVLTPFRTTGGAVVLVNRGWLPLAADRRSLPDVPTDGAVREIAGRLNNLTSAGPRLGEPDRLSPDDWPQLVTYLDQAPVEDALGMAVLPWVVQLDADQADGFAARDWRPATMEPATHGGYALQWFALAAAAGVIWLLLGWRRGAREAADAGESTR